MVEQPPEPHGDVGVLLVHGIGDHKEGETLTSFGEPLIDWLREWLRGKSKGDAVELLGLAEARLKATRNEAESPAYAVATVHAPTDGKIEPLSERWLLCEAWWGDSVQPPVALKLLKWLWSRGPLLILWHFYLRSDTKESADEEVEPTREDAFRSVIAFMLAASCQIVVVIALVLWLIPIGKWRQAVANAVRALTLTLGDSYVLLEHDIQRAALVERVERSLEWLAARCDKVVVLAHSQGGAIAHEALTQSDRSKIYAFVSIGSGLEKLLFLRRVREQRDGVIAAPLMAPLVVCGATLLVYGLSPAGQRWQIGVGGFVLFAGLLSAGVVLAAFVSYREALVKEMPRLKLSRSDGEIEWTDLSASHDVVPMGAGSLLTSQSFVRRVSTANEQSYLHDHVSYFQNRSSSLASIWQALGKVSGIRLFEDREVAILGRFSRLHLWYARVLTWAHRSTYLAILLSLVVFRDALVGFGASIIGRVDGSPLSDLLKPVRTVAAGAAWLIQLAWAPQASVSDLLAQGIVGGLVLVGGLTLWTVAFTTLWRAGTMHRWRRACRGHDVLYDRISDLRSFGLCMTVLGLGSLPLLFVLILIIAPQILSLTAVGEALGAAVALICFGGSVLFALVGPWQWQWQLDDERRGAGRDFLLSQFVLYPFVIALLVWGLFQGGAALWPYAGQGGMAAIGATVWFVHALAWQVYAFTRPKATMNLAWRLVVAAAPFAAATAWWIGRGQAQSLRSIAFVYSGAAILSTAAAVFAANRQILAHGVPALVRVTGRAIREGTIGFWR